jgi:hypothetical protein
MAGLPTAGFFGDALGFIGKAVGAFIPGVSAAVDVAQAVFGGKKGATPVAPAMAFCPTGFRMNPSTGRCEKVGVVGAIERFVPGGATGTLPAVRDDFGPAVVGQWGVPALEPATVTAVRRRCPKGAVLGDDDLCYQKGSIPRKNRKWPPPARPLLTGGETKIIRKAKALEGRVETAWKSVGKPGNRPAPKPCTKQHHHHT